MLRSNKYHFFDHYEGWSQFPMDQKHFQKPQIHDQQRESIHSSCEGKGFRWMEMTYKERHDEQ